MWAFITDVIVRTSPASARINGYTAAFAGRTYIKGKNILNVYFKSVFFTVAGYLFIYLFIFLNSGVSINLCGS